MSNYMNKDNLINRNIIEKLNEVANQKIEEDNNQLSENIVPEMDDFNDFD